MQNQHLFIFLFFCFSLFCQKIYTQDYTGIWEYEVLDTESGDYYGQMILSKKYGQYEGKIVNDKGEQFSMSIIKQQDDSLVILTDAEGFFSTIYGVIQGDTFDGLVVDRNSSVNSYDFFAKRKIAIDERVIRQFELKDEVSKELISYAHIYFSEGGTVTNNQGVFSVKQSNGGQVKIAAIGYEEKKLEIDWNQPKKASVIYLQPTNALLPQVDVQARTLKAVDIVKAAILRIPENYHQSAYNARLFIRHKSFGPEGQLGRHSEAILKFYDSIGYKKGNWRKAAKARFAQLEEGRILSGMDLSEPFQHELSMVTFFWEHEPIITYSKSFSLRSLDGYDFKLLKVMKIGAEEVYQIGFVCKKLKTRFTGLSSLKVFEGTLFIKKADYALIRYESYSDMDYSYTNKHTKKKSGGGIRIVLRTNKLELFHKKEGKYALAYAKSDEDRETHHLGNGQIAKGRYIDEIQTLSLDTQNIEIIEDNLFNTKNDVKYNAAFWNNFNLVKDCLLYTSPSPRD